MITGNLFAILFISGLGNSGNDLAKLAKGADYKGGKDFTRGKAEEIKKYIEGVLK